MASQYDHRENQEALKAYMKHFTEGNVDAIMELLVSASLTFQKSVSSRIPPSNMRAPASRSMMESGRSSQLTGPIALRSSYALIRDAQIDPHIPNYRDQFPGFYAQFRELNKAIGASGDGDLKYIYDNLMITEVLTFFDSSYFRDSGTSPRPALGVTWTLTIFFWQV